MKTLIFNGSARKNGETQSMIDALTAQLEGEYKIVNAHSCNVRACIDCRYCWEHPECSIRDGWQEIDSYLRECDNVVIASPVYFCEITGPVLSVLSRIQVYWAAKTFRHEKLLEKPKRGGMILLGGGQGTATAPMNTSAVLLRQMNAKEIAKTFRHEKLLEKPKRGGMILLGGGQGTATAPMNTSAVLLRQMNAKEIFDPVCCFATDHHHALEDEETMADLKKFAQFLNRK